MNARFIDASNSSRVGRERCPHYARSVRPAHRHRRAASTRRVGRRVRVDVEHMLLC